MKTSLGLLEVAGLALAIKVADIMAKAASVEITGIERTNGSGWMLVSVAGDVASVNAAITQGAALARVENGWVADRVIARPAGALDIFLSPQGAPIAATVAAAADASCNLCHDPACSRHKGEPRAACIHYAQRGTL